MSRDLAGSRGAKSERENMDDFLKVLGVGLGLFLVAILVAGYIPASPGGSYPFDESAPKKEKSILELDIGSFGNLQKSASHQPFKDVSVGYALAREDLDKKEEVVIKNGLFTKVDKSFTFSGIETDTAYLSFILNSSNYYGPLVVEFNDQEIYSNFSDNGRYMFELFDLKEKNDLTIKAGSSGAKFWAPTTYVLNDVGLEVNKYGYRDTTYVFKVSADEYNSWSGGRIAFVVKEGTTTGKLNIEVNGHLVYSGTPKVDKQAYVDFTKFENDITAGENTIRFYADKDGKFVLKNVNVIIFSNTGRNTVLVKRFAFPAGPYYYYAKEDKAKLYFQISGRQVREGPLSMYLNENLYKVNVTSYQFNATVPIDFEDINSGNNELKFRTTGIYTIDSFDLMFNGTLAEERSFSSRWSIVK